MTENKCGLCNYHFFLSSILNNTLQAYIKSEMFNHSATFLFSLYMQLQSWRRRAAVSALKISMIIMNLKRLTLNRKNPLMTKRLKVGLGLVGYGSDVFIIVIVTVILLWHHSDIYKQMIQVNPLFFSIKQNIYFFN